MSLADRALDEIDEALNVGGRSAGHVALGFLLCLAAVGATAAVAASRAQPTAPGAEPTRHPLGRAMWPAFFSLTTVAALRVWNAPDSPKRTEALGLWGALQGLNLFWMLLAPARRPLQVMAATTVAGLTAAYAHAAAAVDSKAAAIAAPAGFAGLSKIVAKPPA